MLVVNVISHNESERFLRQMLEHTQRFADVIVVTDDHSTDDTPQIARDCGANVYEAPEGVGFRLDESALRQLSWENMERHIEDENTWIACIDCDELLWGYSALPALTAQTQYSVLGVPFFHLWKDDYYRADKLWAPTISSRIFKYRAGASYRNRKLACGAEPSYVAELVQAGQIMWQTPLLFEHLGYVRDNDKLMKYERYMELDAGQFHNINHLQSIIDKEVQLVDFRPYRKP